MVSQIGNLEGRHNNTGRSHNTNYNGTGHWRLEYGLLESLDLISKDICEFWDYFEPDAKKNKNHSIWVGCNL